MKNILIFTLIIITQNFVFSQNKIEKLDYEETLNKKIYRKFDKVTSVIQYVTKENEILKIGDTLQLGKPNTEKFRFIIYNNKNYIENLKQALQSNNFLFSKNKSNLGIITQITAYHENLNKRKPLQIAIVLKSLKNKDYDYFENLTVKNFELAFLNREIILPRKKKVEIRKEEDFKIVNEKYELDSINKEVIKTNIQPKNIEENKIIKDIEELKNPSFEKKSNSEVVDNELKFWPDEKENKYIRSFFYSWFLSWLFINYLFRKKFSIKDSRYREGYRMPKLSIRIHFTKYFYISILLAFIYGLFYLLISFNII